MKIGYKVAINKKEQKLEGVYVLVLSPFGLSEIPVADYILIFCETTEEMTKVIMESFKCVKDTIAEVDFEVAI
jgi:hypothetical protein